MRLTISLLALALLPVVLAQDAGPDPIVAGVRSKIPDKLETLLTEALKANPDVLVAEARLKEAATALNQARLEVAQRAAALFHERVQHLTIQGSLRKEYDEAKALHETGHVDQAHVRQIALRQAENDARIAQIEAEIRYVLGAGGAVGTVRLDGVTQALDAPVEEGSPTLPRPSLEEAGVQRPLLQTMTVDWQAVPIGKVVEDLQKATGGELAFVLHSPIGPTDYEVTLNLPNEATVAHVLSALADYFQGDICFVFRDYGVLVTDADSAVDLAGPAIPPDVPLQPRYRR